MHFVVFMLQQKHGYSPDANIACKAVLEMFSFINIFPLTGPEKSVSELVFNPL